MIICLLSIIVFIIFINTKYYKKIDCIKKIFLIIYTFEWLIFTAISSTTYGNTFALENSTVLIFVGAVFSFVLGFILWDLLNLYSTNKQTSTEVNINNLNNKIILGTQIVIIIILIFYKIKQMSVIATYGDEIKRMMTFEIGYLFNSSIEAGIFNYFLTAVISILTVLCLKNIISKKITITEISQLIIAILLFLITYGRLIFFSIIIYSLIWIIILYGNSMKKYIKKNIKWISLLILTTFLLLVISSMLRVGFKMKDINTVKESIDRTFSQGVLYFTGGQKAFEVAIKNEYRDLITNEYGAKTNGGATFAWIEQGLSKILGKENSINNVMGKIMQNPIKIGQYQEFNAFYTGIFNFYVDFGYLGIFIMQFLYGVLISFLIEFYRKKPNIGRALLLNINLTFALFSEFRWYYQSLENINMIIISLIIIFFIEKIKKESK